MSTFGRIAASVLFSAALTSASAATCVPAAVPALVRAEGLTERVGDIALSCTGAPGEALRGSLTLFLSTNATNRLSATGALLGAALTTTVTGTPEPAGQAPVPVGVNGITFSDIDVVLPASGVAELRVTGVRAAVANAPAGTQITALISFTGAPVVATSVVVGLPSPGLLAGYSAGSVNCYGSPLPQTITMANLFAAGTRVFSARATEGYSGAFEPRPPNADSGTRILVRYSGFPAQARLFVPDVIAGSSALQPTAGGDLVQPRAAGQYAPGPPGSLLLARVPDANSTGAGGTPVFIPTPDSGTVALNAAGEVQLTGGAGFVVYEVVDANASLRENAEIPTFLGMPRVDLEAVTVARQSILLAPVSTVAVATATDPIPRFVATEPPSDCTELGDCAAFPQLFVNAPRPFTFTAHAGDRVRSEWATVQNPGGGMLAWTTHVTYRTGSDWVNVFVNPPTLTWPGWFRVDADPSNLAPGTYEAVLTVDAGPTAGSRDVPITLVVTEAPPEPPRVASVVHAATFQPAGIVPGSLATLLGAGLTGGEVSVTFDGMAAALLFTGEGQINLQVPAALAPRPTAQMVVTVDGIASQPVTVQLTSLAPAIFANGILNQDNSVNSATNPAALGSAIQVFLTGLTPDETATVSARIHDRDIPLPDYSGEAPGLTGVQQVNIRVPADLPAMTTEVLVCGTSRTTAQTVCSPPVRVSIQ